MAGYYGYHDNIVRLHNRYLVHHSEYVYDELSRVVMKWAAGYLNYKFRAMRDVHDDMVSVAMLGFCKAVQKFNPQSGVRFVTFMQFMVHKELLEGIRHGEFGHSTIPRTLLDFEKRRQKVISDFLLHNFAEPADIIIWKEMRLTERKYNEISSAHASATFLDSLDALRDTVSPLTFIAMLKDRRAEFADKVIDREYAADCIDELEPELRSTMRLLYYSGMSACETGKALGITTSAVHKRHKQALDHIRHKSIELCVG